MGQLSGEKGESPLTIHLQPTALTSVVRIFITTTTALAHRRLQHGDSELTVAASKPRFLTSSINIILDNGRVGGLSILSFLREEEALEALVEVPFVGRRGVDGAVVARVRGAWAIVGIGGSHEEDGNESKSKELHLFGAMEKESSKRKKNKKQTNQLTKKGDVII